MLFNAGVRKIVIKISATNCVQQSITSNFEFIIINQEEGPNVIDNQLGSVIKVVQGQIVPRLTGQIKYFYSNCQTNQTFVRENVTIEMKNGTAFIDSGIKLNADGSFNSSLL